MSHIMVINDAQEVLQLFHNILTDEGYCVSLYSYGMQDLDEVIRLKPDMVILDYVVSNEQPGWQMLQKMKMTRLTAKIPILVCTTTTKLIQEIQGFLNSKGVSVLAKPFDIDELLTAVKTSLDLHDSFAQIRTAPSEEEVKSN